MSSYAWIPECPKKNRHTQCLNRPPPFFYSSIEKQNTHTTHTHWYLYISHSVIRNHTQNNKIIKRRYESTPHSSAEISEEQRGHRKSRLKGKVVHWQNVWGGVYLKRWVDRGWRQEEEWEESELQESGRGWIRRRARVKIIKRGGMEGRRTERGGGMWNGNRMWSDDCLLEPVFPRTCAVAWGCQACRWVYV